MDSSNYILNLFEQEQTAFIVGVSFAFVLMLFTSICEFLSRVTWLFIDSLRFHINPKQHIKYFKKLRKLYKLADKTQLLFIENAINQYEKDCIEHNFIQL